MVGTGREKGLCHAGSAFQDVTNPSENKWLFSTHTKTFELTAALNDKYFIWPIYIRGN